MFTCRGFWTVLFGVCCAGVPGGAEEFTVIVYNVENLFDADGIAVFDDYRPGDADAGGYRPLHLLTKLRKITEVLSAVNEGRGPEIVLFQEFELDRTPFSDGGGSPHAFLRAHARTTVESMLTDQFSPAVAGIPVELLLLKHLVDQGLAPYEVAKPDPFSTRNPTAHTNVIFSRYPIRRVWHRSLASARDLLVVAVDVGGHELILMNNHWKAGASNRSMEPIRVQNAHAVRAELLEILLRHPAADIIVAGDFNSHYNQRAVVPELAVSAVEDVLGSVTDEARFRAGTFELPHRLYNLWAELPPEERGSEVWRGEWGTLMQMLISPGLCDGAGVDYVDGSFFRLILPGRNVESFFGTPRSWVPDGAGAGFSDHLPIGARFRIAPGGRQEAADFDYRRDHHSPGLIPVDYRLSSTETIQSATFLNELTPEQLAAQFGKVFRIEGRLAGEGARSVRVGDRVYGLYVAPLELREGMLQMPDGAPFQAFGQLVRFRAHIQFVIQRPDWMLPPDN